MAPGAGTEPTPDTTRETLAEATLRWRAEYSENARIIAHITIETSLEIAHGSAVTMNTKRSKQRRDDTRNSARDSARSSAAMAHDTARETALELAPQAAPVTAFEHVTPGVLTAEGGIHDPPPTTIPNHNRLLWSSANGTKAASRTITR